MTILRDHKIKQQTEWLLDCLIRHINDDNDGLDGDADLASDLPTSLPQIYGLNPNYRLGETLNLTCESGVLHSIILFHCHFQPYMQIRYISLSSST